VPILIPAWFTRLDSRDPDDVRLRNRYFVKSAALVNDPSGKLEDLAEALGIAYPTLVSTYAGHYGKITPPMAVRLEKLLGGDVLTRAMLRPDIFA
jgi:hypothetical protein